MSLVYYILFSTILICSFIEFFNSKGLGKPIYYSIVVAMCLISGLAYAMSPDWVAYFKNFSYMPYLSWGDLPRWSIESSMEVGYLRLNKLLSMFGFGFGMLTLVISSLSLYLKSSTFYKYGGFPLLVLFIYSMPNFMFEEHVHIRQGLANAISLYSVRYIIDRKLIKFLICLAIAYQFHQSVIVFILAYWIAPMNFNERIIGWLVALSIIGFYTGLNSVIEVIMQYMPFGQSKFEDYQGDLYNTEGGVALGDFVKIITVLSIIIYNKHAKHDKIYCYFRNLYVFGVLLFFFLGKGIFGIRLPGFYLVFMGMTVGRMLYNFSGDSFKRSFIYISFSLYTVLLIFWFQVKQGSNLKFYDYKTFFSEGSVYGLWR